MPLQYIAESNFHNLYWVSIHLNGIQEFSFQPFPSALYYTFKNLIILSVTMNIFFANNFYFSLYFLKYMFFVLQNFT